MIKRLGLLASLVFAAAVGFAVAQGVSVPKVANVGANDLFQDIVNGQPQAGNVYASAGQISGVQLYANETTAVNGTGDPAYHFTNGVVNAFAHASGAITTATLTTEPNPTDGKRECWWADQTTTTLAWTANTGQTIDGNKHAAGIQYVSNCIVYQASNATWYSSN